MVEGPLRNNALLYCACELQLSFLRKFKSISFYELEVLRLSIFLCRPAPSREPNACYPFAVVGANGWASLSSMGKGLRSPLKVTERVIAES